MQLQITTNTYTQKLTQILALVFLLILSNCSVRKTIQSALDLPLTQVTSPSKTGVSSCDAAVENTQKVSKKREAQKLKKTALPFVLHEVIFTCSDQLHLYRFNLFDYHQTLPLYRRINKVLDDRFC